MHAARLRLPDAPVLGFDLDLTLIDTLEATACALSAVDREFSLGLDVDGVVAGQATLRQALAELLPPPLAETIMRHFYRVFHGDCIGLVRPVPGAREILTALRERGGRSVVITGRREAGARYCLAAVGLSVDAVAGGVRGTGKAPLMTKYRVDAFVGDHVLDMAGARDAGVQSVGVLSGAHDADALRQAGAVMVLPSVADLVAWLDPARKAPGPSRNPGTGLSWRGFP